MSCESVPYEANKLYKFTWALNTDQSNTANVPTIRLRVSEASFAYTMEMTIQSAGSTNPFMPPTVGIKNYNMYVMPITTGAMYPVFDVYDFETPGDVGTVWLDQLDVYVLELPTSGWTAETVPSFSSWAALTSIPPFNSVGSSTAGGLGLTSTVADAYNFGIWSSPMSIPYTDNRLYRAQFTIVSSDSAPPNGMVRVSSEDFQVGYRLRYYPATAPDADGEVYPVYFETHEYVAGKNHFGLNFEIADFETDRGGTIRLTDVTVQHHSLIP